MNDRPLNFDDPRWTTMLGGYRVPYDPRDALRSLESDDDSKKPWDELWNELHHQGDVGETSYAAVPHLVRIYENCGTPHWNTYAIVATIDHARRTGDNPELPAFLADAYHAAWRRLAEYGLSEFSNAQDEDLIRSILAVLAIWKGQFDLGELASNFSQDEIEEFLKMAENG